MIRNLITTIFLILALSVNAQNNEWDAKWITVPGVGNNSAGLYLFRKTLQLDSAPQNFEVRVSADPRYKLYVNEKLVSTGPAWSDLDHWNYETIDLAPWLKTGENIISAQVWNEGELKAIGQFSYRTGFLVQGTSDETKVLNTNDSWKCIEDKSYTPIRQKTRGYYAAGAGDRIDMNRAVKGWKKAGFDDSGWEQAKPVFERSARGNDSNTSEGWSLNPSIIPPMELTYQRLVSTRKAEGISVPSSFPAEKTEVTVPANTSAKILLDQSFLTNAYPTLIFSSGTNSTIIITYAEALYDESGAKNNRNEIEGKIIVGRQDTIFSDGSQNQEFTALHWRTFRYLEMEIETNDSPLVIEDVYGTFTGYPFEMNATLESDVDEFDKIMEIGWRTARLCAVETYMDCPYYEQLQYIGDTRIQMMLTYYNSGDDRLPKNALNLFDYSRQKDGYTLSRYPDTQDQIIPTYSLWHVSTLYDYLMYGKDKEFLKKKLLGSRQILNYFISYLDEDGSLKNVPGWNFTDWVPDWKNGVAPTTEDGTSALMDLQLLLALQSAIALENSEGLEEYALLYEKLAKQLEKNVKDKYWDESKNLFADTPQKNKFSQHANSLAILAGLADSQKAREIGKILMSDNSLAPASIYFKYYLYLALTKAGFGDSYTHWLDVWRKNIDLGLTTWGETSEVETTRSDCHAWGSSPNIEFFRIVLGIESASPYFEKVKIEPHLGEIKNISGEIPHPKGHIAVDFQNSDTVLKAKITLPDGITGEFVWKGKSYGLSGGVNGVEANN